MRKCYITVWIKKGGQSLLHTYWGSCHRCKEIFFASVLDQISCDWMKTFQSWLCTELVLVPSNGIYRLPEKTGHTYTHTHLLSCGSRPFSPSCENTKWCVGEPEREGERKIWQVWASKKDGDGSAVLWIWKPICWDVGLQTLRILKKPADKWSLSRILSWCSAVMAIMITITGQNKLCLCLSPVTPVLFK